MRQRCVSAPTWGSHGATWRVMDVWTLTRRRITIDLKWSCWTFCSIDCTTVCPVFMWNKMSWTDRRKIQLFNNLCLQTHLVSSHPENIRDVTWPAAVKGELYALVFYLTAPDWFTIMEIIWKVLLWVTDPVWHELQRSGLNPPQWGSSGLVNSRKCAHLTKSQCFPFINFWTSHITCPLHQLCFVWSNEKCFPSVHARGSCQAHLDTKYH